MFYSVHAHVSFATWSRSSQTLYMILKRLSDYNILQLPVIHVEDLFS